MTSSARWGVALGVATLTVALTIVFVPGLLHRWLHDHPRGEPRSDLRKMFDGAVHHFETTGRFPASTPLTPARRACAGGASVEHEGRAADWRHPTWQALGFRPKDPFRMQYQFVSDATGFTARAHGDLNCDGALSTFERSAAVRPDGTLEAGAGLYAKDETE